MPAANILVQIQTPLEATVDIVIVHGMNPLGNKSHEEDVWKDKETGVNWVRDLLPGQVPSARILAFQYNGNILFGPSIAGVAGQAENLLECPRMKRKLNPLRPIIWIAHSLGGIIIKEVLVTASKKFQAYPMISTFTYAIFFIAVPHRGSPYASFGTIASNIAGLIPFKQTNSFLQSVTTDSDYNKELDTRFEPLLKLYKFYTWIEGREVPGVGLIVPEDSARLNLPPPQQICRVTERHHRNICQFSASNDPEWNLLSAAISEATQEATGWVSYSPTLDRSNNMTGELQHHSLCIHDLLGAIREAEVVVGDMYTFCHGTELQGRDREAGVASDVALSLAKLLLVVMSPILSLSSSSSSNILTVVAALLLNSILAVLPGKDYLIEKAKEGQEAEQAIMKVEEWAIDRLNGYQRAALRTSQSLQQNIAALELQEIDDAQVLLLVQGRHLQDVVQTLVERNTQDIHERRVKFERAERIATRTEEVTHKIEDKTKLETYMAVEKEIRAEQKKQDSENENSCPMECTIL
ncbi:kinesin [Fusarium pseudocircinatum]|uniref:Kinesin n=1 Tax=Fusarium pseudocircinatum TaxID=56676 RepID=A0A8H5P732_9HYPO|nr:kinesin [Fusarium pseudocircinatum]